MGLFRRGTKLLKLSGGLRDCCCRPEKPDECWCPGYCAYYVVADGIDGRNAETGELPDCTSPARYEQSESCVKSYRLGNMGDAPCEDRASLGITGNPSSLNVLYQIGVTPFNDATWPGITGALGARRTQGFSGLISGVLDPQRFAEPWYPSVFSVFTNTAQIQLVCRGSAQGAPEWGVFAEFSIQYRMDVREASSYLSLKQSYRIIRGRIGNYIDGIPAKILAGECGNYPEYLCEGVTPFNQLHIPDLTFTLNADGLDISGSDFSQQIGWDYFENEHFCSETRTGAGPTQYLDCDPEELPLPSESLTTYTVQFKKRESCIPVASDCDCNQSLDGMVVFFAGGAFRYGDLEEFYLDGTLWAEFPPGTFTRYDFEDCNGSLYARVRQAVIECTTVGGVQQWVAYLEDTCDERDDATCPAPPDVRRIRQWTGVFSCGGDGKPGGSLGSVELDYDSSTDTPSAECAGTIDPPSLSISAPA